MLRGKQLQTFQRMSVASSSFTNKLATEKSPYLLQHKNNPIEWYPWGEEAFNRAKSLNRPIFLSVGYSTCHWCHVMERESFEIQDVANALNESFVSIKVDREERPDVDKLYMSFVQAITGSGGWPMSVFLTPSLEPFFGGTYFPQANFLRILKLVSDKWSAERDSLVGQGKSIMDALGKGSAYKRGDCPPLDTVVNGAFQYKATSFDKKYAGFGTEPKFPKPVDLEFLLNYYAWSPEGASKELAREMLDRTLEAMALGGIHDHIGRGFHRYSVDAEWHIPHFEKMLYDQTQLLAVYSDFTRLTNKKFGHVVRNIADYMMECLHHPEGGFYAAEDADSLPTAESTKKKEGAFCVWTKAQIHSLLSGCDPCGSLYAAETFCRYFDVHEGGNVPQFMDPHSELTNQNVLRMKKTHTDLASDLNVSEVDLWVCIDECKSILRGARCSRPPPHLDSKMVTAWQGLAISAFAKASAALDDKELLMVAERCASFVKKYCTLEGNEEELIRAVYRGEDDDLENVREPIAAFSDDYAFLIQGLLDLYARNGDESLLKWADQLQLSMNAKFWDRSGETGYFISEEHGNVHVRIQEDQDGAEPCANSVALSNLVRLSELLDSDDHKNRASKILEGSSERLSKHPYILPKMISPFKRLEEGGTKIVIVGDPLDEQVKEMLAVVDSKYIWDGSLVRIDTAKPPTWLLSKCADYSSMMEQKGPLAMVCRGFVCGLPLRSADQLKEAISQTNEN